MAYISVACKVPNGIILRTGAFVDVPESVLGGGVRISRVWQADGKSIELKGPARPFGGEAKAPVEGGYALNHQIDSDLWERWLADNKDSPLVTNHIVFAAAKRDAIEGQARDKRDIRSGMEPLNPRKDPRTTTLNSKVEPEEGRKAS